MRRTYQILLPLYGLLLTRVDLTDLFPLRLPVQVLKIYDGDTLLVQHGSYRQKVRLSRIDAPEKGQPFLGSQGDAGAFARACLVRQLGKSEVLEIEGTDMYGRTLGDLEGLSLRLISKGCATLYPYARFRSREEKFIFLKAWFRAKKEKRGLWGKGGFRRPNDWRRKNKFRKRA